MNRGKTECVTYTGDRGNARVLESRFDYPPFNVVDGDVFQALQDLLVRMETTESLRVVVFESALPDFYLSHFDLTGRLGNVMSAIGPSGLPMLMDTFVRLTKAPVVSLARIRGCFAA